MERFKNHLLKVALFTLILLAGLYITRNWAASRMAMGGTASLTPPREDRSKNENANESQQTRISVYASFYPMYDFAVKIGGERVQVTNMASGAVEPHEWEPAAADVAGLEKAAVFICNGLSMEPWIDDVLGSLQNKKLVVVNASKGISPEDRGDMDPHVWLDPMNAKQEMANIRDAFIQVDPKGKEYYEANFHRYARELDALNESFRKALLPFAGKSVVVTHGAFQYLCSACGLNQVAVEGAYPESEPTPARMSEIIEFVRKNGVKTVFYEEEGNPKVAETVAKAAGAKTAVLNPLEGLSDRARAAGDDYFSVMRRNLKSLLSAFQ
ncbi:MAG: zinc ABC transporter substrate-binding protein [Synergistaceae bacterium]|jgi:zinc transport system substrate-binding protein|nr:zinc ABC transporter substrate-binding protein [Synergistaceae bacterium]